MSFDPKAEWEKARTYTLKRLIRLGVPGEDAEQVLMVIRDLTEVHEEAMTSDGFTDREVTACKLVSERRGDFDAWATLVAGLCLRKGEDPVVACAYLTLDRLLWLVMHDEKYRRNALARELGLSKLFRGN